MIASPDGILDGVVHTYSAAALGWLAAALPLAQRLFAVLATLELAVSGLLWALGREGLDAVAAGLLKKFLVLAFLFTLLFEFPLWLPAVTRSFEAAGQAASGTTTVNPSLLLDDGIAIGAHMLHAIDDAGPLPRPPPAPGDRRRRPPHPPRRSHRRRPHRPPRPRRLRPHRRPALPDPLRGF